MCSTFAPPDGPFMLDDVLVEAKRTVLYFTEDAGNIVTARRPGSA